MNYRTSDILAETEVTADITKTINLDLSEIISRLDITFRVDPSVHTMSLPSYKMVTGIEIVDGSNVLYSLDGGQCQALNIYDRKVGSMSHGQHIANLSDFQTYGIDFGKYLWDETLAFDPSHFKNPQLKVSLDVNAIGGTPTDMHLRVRGHLFDAKSVTPSGFIMSKEHFSYIPATSNAYEYVELPQDYPIKRMLVQAYRLDYEPWYVISEVKLDENNEKVIPFDVEVEDYVRRRKGIDPPVEEALICRAGVSAEKYYTTPTSYYTPISLGCYQEKTIYMDPTPRAGGISLKSSGTEGHVFGMIRGELPNHCINFPFGDQMNEADWYDAAALKKARVRLKCGTGNANNVVSVVLQQLRPY